MRSALPTRRKQSEDLAATVHFEKHQPERRRAIGGYLFCSGGCCCCCCCLHSLGGLIGAAIGTATGTATKRSPAERPIVGYYWTFLGICIAPVFILVVAASQTSGTLFFGSLIAIMFLPLLQLLASLVTVAWVHVRRADLPDRRAGLRILGHITLWAFLGALAGLAVMFLWSKKP